MRHVCSFVFFSSRRRHTRYWRDWSSDVCSSDLLTGGVRQLLGRPRVVHAVRDLRDDRLLRHVGETERDRHRVQEDEAEQEVGERRSEERRVGKRVDLGGRRILKIKTKTIHLHTL